MRTKKDAPEYQRRDKEKKQTVRPLQASRCKMTGYAMPSTYELFS